MDLASLRARAATWLAHDPDPRTRAQLQRLLDAEPDKLAAAFAGRVRFGTAGLRAEVGPGPMHLNALVVRQSVAGIVRVLARCGQAGQLVAVGYDGRLDSAAWAEDVVGVLRAHGHPVAWFDAPTPTPLVGFWVKQRALVAGIVITASHNPPQDNGMKVYWSGGAQIAPPIDGEIARAIDEVAAEPEPVPFLQKGDEGPACYTPRLEAQRLYCEQLAQAFVDTGAARQDVRIAYTPLHGVGDAMAHQALVGAPLERMTSVASQREPDGHFPTVRSPNPEDAASLREVLALAERQECDLACANDPDADRLAVAVRCASGRFEVLTGDELGLVLARALLLWAPQPATCALASSCVSSRLLATMCAAFGATHTSTLPGFKWLAQAMQAAERQGHTPLLAYEEALGFMPTTLAWDKDGISTLRLVTLLAAERRARGQTLLDALCDVHTTHGLSVTTQATLAIEGARGGAGGSAWMQTLRAHPPAFVGAYAVTALDDGYAPERSRTFAGLPPSDALALWLAPVSDAERAEGAEVRIIVRPSGTEPKLKAYVEGIAAAPTRSTWPVRRAQLREELSSIKSAYRALVLACAP